jgi:hypothetical protein
MKRTTTVLFGLTVLLAGCRDLGLPGNVPEQEARTATPPELVAQVMAPAERDQVRLVVDGRLWVPTGSPVTLGAAGLRPVGATAGQTVYARPWDERPYRAIFTRVVMPEPGAATTARAAMEGRLEHWQEYAPVIGRRSRATRPSRVAPAEEDLDLTEEGTDPAEDVHDLPASAPGPAGEGPANPQPNSSS